MNGSQTSRIRLLFVLTTLIPILVLAWLGVRTLRHERDAERQRARESLEVAAGRLALDIDRKLSAIEELLSRGEGLQFEPEGIIAPPEHPLLYGPEYMASLTDSPQADVFELDQPEDRNLTAAGVAFQRLTQSRDPGVRAGALVRLARVRRKRGDKAGALQAYETLQEMDLQPVDGEPSVLKARLGKAKVFEEAGDSEALRHEADAIAQLLYHGVCRSIGLHSRLTWSS